MTGHLVMLHGFSGTSEMIKPLAEQVCPERWQVCVINGPFTHPQRGYTWWTWSGKSNETFDVNKLKELKESVEHVLSSLPEEGPLIVGGFSQGAAVAQELLLTEVAQRIAGVIVIGSKAARPSVLLDKLAELPPKRMCSMHGGADEIILLKHGEECANLYEEGGWEVTRMHHNKGHTVDIDYLEQLKKWVSNSAQR